jgi:hypothetical protein
MRFGVRNMRIRLLRMCEFGEKSAQGRYYFVAAVNENAFKRVI